MSSPYARSFQINGTLVGWASDILFSRAARSHVPMAVTSETMICRQQRRATSSSPHVNVTFYKEPAAASERCDAHLAIPPQSRRYSLRARRIGNVRSRRLFVKSGVWDTRFTVDLRVITTWRNEKKIEILRYAYVITPDAKVGRWNSNASFTRKDWLRGPVV